MGVIINMVEYRLHDVEPFFKYILISVGSSFLLVISLLMCGKKSKKSNITTEPSSVEPKSPHPVIEEEIIVAVEETTFECMPMENEVNAKKASSPTTVLPILPKQPLRKVLSSIDTNSVSTPTGDLIKTLSDGSNPYDTVANKKYATPVFEYSGNSDSGNSIYAKVQDVPAREETAYAVVDIKDKDYDFVNGVLVRRVPGGSVSGETDNSEILHYDKPNPAASKVVIDETENFGSSSIYESVTDNNKENLEPLTTKSSNDSGLYDFCGPAAYPNQEKSLSHENIRIDLTDITNNALTSNNDDNVKHDTCNIQLKPQTDIPRRGSSKEKLDQSNKSEKDESRLSRYLKFSHSNSKKTKKEEIYEVDIPINNIESAEDAPPPPVPSYIKLKHISASQRGQQTKNDKSYSPEPSVSGSSPNSSPRNQPLFVYDERSTNLDNAVNSCHTHEDFNIHKHRPRMSEGSISIRDLHLDCPLKSQCSLPAGCTRVVSESIINKDNIANSIHLVLEKTCTDVTNSDGTRGSLISEPDYAEIESRIDNSLPTANHPIIVSDDNSQVTKGYTEIDYGNGPHEIVTDGDGNVSKGYAVVNFNKKNEDRRIRDLYAAVDFSSKKPREFDMTEDNPSVPMKYEGPYDIIPENNSEAVKQEQIYEELNSQNN